MGKIMQLVIALLATWGALAIIIKGLPALKTGNKLLPIVKAIAKIVNRQKAIEK